MGKASQSRTEAHSLNLKQPDTSVRPDKRSESSLPLLKEYFLFSVPRSRPGRPGRPSWAGVRGLQAPGGQDATRTRIVVTQALRWTFAIPGASPEAARRIFSLEIPLHLIKIFPHRREPDRNQQKRADKLQPLRLPRVNSPDRKGRRPELLAHTGERIRAG